MEKEKGLKGISSVAREELQLVSKKLLDGLWILQ